MDVSDPEIRFSENGYCNHCSGYLSGYWERRPPAAVREARLQELVGEMKQKGKSKKYDCVLGISGGVDSCYVACMLKELGLRVLLVHMDNGWNAEEAVCNIRNTATSLGFDYVSYVLDWEEFRDIQLAFLKASVVEAETPTDIAIQGALHRIAARHGVQYIISGGNMATEGILPRLWHYNAKDTVYFNAIVRQFGKTGKVKLFPQFGYRTEAYYKIVRGIRTVYLLNYLDFSKKEAVVMLREQMGWKDYGGKHYESRYTRFVQSYLLPVKFGLDYRKATLSTQICTGEVLREAALRVLEHPPYEKLDLPAEKQYISKKLGITPEELDAIIAAPPRRYSDYPNDEKRLDLVYRLYRWLRRSRERSAV